MFGFFKKKPQPAPEDPLATYDGQVEAVERDGAELRRAAATLLAHKAGLQRELGRREAERVEISSRLDEASRAGDARGAALLGRDLSRVESVLEEARASLSRAEVEAELLVESAREVAEEVEGLKAERVAAQARIAAGRAAGHAFRAEASRVQRSLALDRARDEVERAYALAELWREERGKR